MPPFFASNSKLLHGVTQFDYEKRNASNGLRDLLLDKCHVLCHARRKTHKSARPRRGGAWYSQRSEPDAFPAKAHLYPTASQITERAMDLA